MNNLQLVDFYVSHAEIILEEPLNKGAPRVQSYWRSLVSQLTQPGTSFTALIDAKPVACGGIYPVWSGVGEAWFLASHRLHCNTFSVAKAVKSNIEKLMSNHGLHRAQATVHCDFKQAHRFAKWLGFKNEGRMKAFASDKSDYYRFAKVII